MQKASSAKRFSGGNAVNDFSQLLSVQTDDTRSDTILTIVLTQYAASFKVRQASFMFYNCLYLRLHSLMSHCHLQDGSFHHQLITLPSCWVSHCTENFQLALFCYLLPPKPFLAVCPLYVEHFFSTTDIIFEIHTTQKQNLLQKMFH